jgi:hypothetical protein
MANPGYVYILYNSAMPTLVKVGQTTRDPSQRAREIGGTGVPGDFAVAYEERVPDCVEAERRVHRALAQHRYNPKREFFKLSLKDAIETVRQIAEDERAQQRQKDAIETARQMAEDERVRRRQKTEPILISQTQPIVARIPARVPPVHPLPLRWGVLSALLGFASVCVGLITVLVIAECILQLSRSHSTGDFVAGVFASIVMLAPCLVIAALLWKGAHALRFRRL